MKKLFNHIFIDGVSGMAVGLFATLIIGTIIGQAATFIDGTVGAIVGSVAFMAKMMTGAGIGVAIATKFKAAPLVVVSTGVCGLIGAHAADIATGAFASGGAIASAGNPLGAFIAAMVGYEIGALVSGKTKIDILITPICSIAAGSVVGAILGPPLAEMMTALGELVTWSAEQRPFLMGILVSVIMGMLLTFPISSAAIAIILGLSGVAAGAATIGCCTHMIGFAVASFKENGFGGLISQGLGTSKLQLPNIMKKPIILLPVVLTSAILGPIGTCVLGLTNDAVGAGMGTSGLVGPIVCYETMMAEGHDPVTTLIKIVVMYFIAPAILSSVIAAFMRKNGWLKHGDMKLDA
ncbi:MAG: PTS sugar transporter subunit IIC [Firmicutes bacterium]|nr:PTS sugar transporter subunit IIC [Bacillota bacterium]